MSLSNSDHKLTCRAGQDTTVKLYKASTGELLRSLEGLEDGIGSITFSPQPKGLIAGGGWYGKLLIWEVEVYLLSYVSSNTDQ